jgi:hypothetical protein
VVAARAPEFPGNRDRGNGRGHPIPVTAAKLEGNAISFSGPDYSFRGEVGAKSITGEMTRAGKATPLSFAKGS